MEGKPKLNGLIAIGLGPKKKGSMAEGGESESPEEDSSEGDSEGSYEAELDGAAQDLIHAVKTGDKETVKLALHRAVKACMQDEQG